MEKKVHKKVGSMKHVDKRNDVKNFKLDKNGEVIIPRFRVKIVEQLCANPTKLQNLVAVLSKYDLPLAGY